MGGTFVGWIGNNKLKLWFLVAGGGLRKGTTEIVVHLLKESL